MKNVILMNELEKEYSLKLQELLKEGFVISGETNSGSMGCKVRLDLVNYETNIFARLSIVSNYDLCKDRTYDGLSIALFKDSYDKNNGAFKWYNELTLEWTKEFYSVGYGSNVFCDNKEDIKAIKQIRTQRYQNKTNNDYRYEYQLYRKGFFDGNAKFNNKILKMVQNLKGCKTIKHNDIASIYRFVYPDRAMTYQVVLKNGQKKVIFAPDSKNGYVY